MKRRHKSININLPITTFVTNSATKVLSNSLMVSIIMFFKEVASNASWSKKYYEKLLLCGWLNDNTTLSVWNLTLINYLCKIMYEDWCNGLTKHQWILKITKNNLQEAHPRAYCLQLHFLSTYRYLPTPVSWEYL